MNEWLNEWMNEISSFLTNMQTTASMNIFYLFVKGAEKKYYRFMWENIKKKSWS